MSTAAVVICMFLGSYVLARIIGGAWLSIALTALLFTAGYWAGVFLL